LEIERAGSRGRGVRPRGDGLPEPSPADRGPGLLPRLISPKLSGVGRFASRSVAVVVPVAALGRFIRPLSTDILPDRPLAI
jgi:hypothetical protein